MKEILTHSQFFPTNDDLPAKSTRRNMQNKIRQKWEMAKDFNGHLSLLQPLAAT